MNTETLRSGFNIGGERIFLEYSSESKYRIATRWQWLASFDNIADATDAFDALELADADSLRIAAKWAKVEISRVPRNCIAGNAMARVQHLVDCIEHRIAGLRPIYRGSKGSVVQWVSV